MGLRTLAGAPPDSSSGPMSTRRRKEEGNQLGRPRARDDDVLRRQIERSILELSGELGYERASVVGITRRGRVSFDTFYSLYRGKDACYAIAYGQRARRLADRMLVAGSGDADWPSAFAAGLIELTTFTEEDPALAAGLIVEVHVAGGEALAEHHSLMARLTRAVDRGGRADGSDGRPTPPAATAIFVVGAIEAATIRCLSEGRPLREMLPGLVHLAVSSYLDPAAARRAVGTLGRA
jgi:AcrR family transcriptional regulator